jgi:superfamily II DNA or RNA helicase
MVEIKVVDSIMGSGKTTAAINLMNETISPDKHFIYITPFLSEIDRIKENTTRRFCSPSVYSDSEEEVHYKFDSFHELLAQNKDIVATHSLFRKSNNETRDLIYAGNYTLILDEVMDVVEQVPLKKNDLQMLFESKLISISDEGKVLWNEERKDWESRFDDIRDMALNDSLIYFRNTILVWNFPVDVFNSFRDVYILTYLFKAQPQKYYYDLHNVTYDTFVATKINNEYVFASADDQKEKEIKNNIKSKIHIYDGILNAIGDKDYSLSKSWYLKKSDYYLKKIKKQYI